MIIDNNVCRIYSIRKRITKRSGVITIDVKIQSLCMFSVRESGWFSSDLRVFGQKHQGMVLDFTSDVVSV